MKTPIDHTPVAQNPRPNLKSISRLKPVLLTLLALIPITAVKVQATPPEVTLTRLHSFGDPPTGPVMPAGRLLEGSDGMLYGATEQGGAGHGTVFRMNKNGSGFIVLKSFANTEGSYPYTGVIEGSDGALYGTTYQGGGIGAGSAYRMKKDGADFTVLKSFAAADGANPSAGLVEGSDGALYGTTEFGGDFGYGTVFRMNKDGSSFSVIKSFNDADGARPLAAVTEGSDGALYSTTINGGISGYGTVFKLNKDGSGFGLLKSFDLGPDGAAPTAGVIEGSDGALYGATQGGSPGAQGSVFRMNKDGSGFMILKTIWDGFDGGPTEGGRPYSGVTEGSDGALYGTTQGGGSLGGGTLFRLNRDGSGFAVLKHMDPATEGAQLYYGLTESSDGALYGTGYEGGQSNGGTVFRLNKDGSGFTILQTLKNWTDGSHPYAGVTEGSDGALYGTTWEGGTFSYGTVFRVNKDGTGFAVVKSFDYGTDGGYPYAGLTEGSDGLLYGTASFGGDFGFGTVFRLNKDGSGFTVLKSLDGGADGGGSSGRLAEGTDGMLYGTTSQNGEFDGGTLFRMNKNGTGFTVLKSFGDGTDGRRLQGGVIEGTDGKLYGTTFGGTAGGGNNTVFQVNKDGTGFTVLKTINPTSDGTFLYGGVIEGSDGALYGTGAQFGPAGDGTVFRLNRDGTGFSVLKGFTGGIDGGLPLAGVTEGQDGALYGTTYRGGTAGYGTVFRVNKDGTGFYVLQSLGAVAGAPTNPRCKVTFGSDGRLYATSSSGGDANVGTIFALQIAQSSQPPSLASINPVSATANGSSFTLTATGSNFEQTTKVYWNGSARSTTYVSPTQVTAQIPASDLTNVTDIQTVNVRVGGPAGPESAAAIFAIVPASVGEVQVSAVPPGQTGTVLSPPTSNTEPGVTLAIQNNGGGSVTAVAATYDTKPTGQTVFKVDSGSFVDVQFTGADSADVAVVNFYYPASITGGQENSVKLRYFDGTNWLQVLSSGGVAPVKNTTNNLDGTVSGGRFTVTFDNTSTPKITELNGTIFGMIDPAPQVLTVSGPTIPLALGTNLSVSVTYATPDPAQVCQITFAWDDGTSTVVTGNNGSVSAAHQYAAAGVYGLTITVTDADGAQGSSKFEYVVIYDPNGGFVTGGGWINSPAGAYVAAPSLTGKATFGFVSKYVKGKTVPTGETEFQFHVANFTFNSTAYEWLVVSGPLAQYKGSGTVNGTGNYSFLLTATDGQISGGGGVDKFRIKIWNKATSAVVYDNVSGASDDINSANPQAIGGGSIVIQKAK